MKVNELGQALLAAILLVGFSTPGHAEDKGATAVPAQELKAKTDYCKTCHGVSGQGFRGSFPMPRLAGQQPEYLKNQLQAFIERRRTNPVMFNVAHVLTPADADGFVDLFQRSQSQAVGWCAKGLFGRREENLSRRRRRQCSSMRFLSWAGCQRRRRVSAFGRSASRLRLQEIDELGQGARTG